MRLLVLCLMAFPVSVFALPEEGIPAGQNEARQRLNDSPRRNQLVSFKSKLGDTIHLISLTRNEATMHRWWLRSTGEAGGRTGLGQWPINWPLKGI